MPNLPLGTVILPASNHSSAPPPTSIATTVATHAQSTPSTTHQIQVQPSYQLPQIQTSQQPQILQPQQPSQVQQPAQLGAQRLVQVNLDNQHSV